MKKLTISFSVFALILSSLAVLFTSSPAKAVDPSYPDQGCVNGVQNSGVYTWTSSSPTVVFTPRFNWLNGVSVRIKSANLPATPRVQAQIWDWHSNPHRMLASHSIELTNRTDEYWEYITMSTQDIDPGLPYALVLVPRDETLVYWSATTNTSCYSRGYAMHGGVQDNSIMYGFSTYGWYDPNNPNSDGTSPGSGTPSGGSTSGSTSGSTGAPAADPAGNNPTGVTGGAGSTGSSSSGTGSTGSQSSKSTSGSNTSKSSWAPDIAGILADYGKDENSGGIGGFLANIFSSPIFFLLWPIISVLFWLGVIILIIMLIARRNKKKKTAVAAATPAAKPEEKKVHPVK